MVMIQLSRRQSELYAGAPRLPLSVLPLPYVESPRPQAGFPSPAQDYVESALDLNEYLILNPVSTFYLKVAGESMSGAGIYPGDIVAVDRSIEASIGRIIVASYDGDILVKWLRRPNGRDALLSDHPTIAYPPYYLDQSQECILWGCVTGLARRF